MYCKAYIWNRTNSIQKCEVLHINFNELNKSRCKFLHSLLCITTFTAQWLVSYQSNRTWHIFWLCVWRHYINRDKNKLGWLREYTYHEGYYLIICMHDWCNYLIICTFDATILTYMECYEAKRECFYEGDVYTWLWI